MVVYSVMNISAAAHAITVYSQVYSVKIQYLSARIMIVPFVVNPDHYCCTVTKCDRVFP